MNQIGLGFGSDANVYAGYASTANERLGSIDFIVQNTGKTTLYAQLKAHDGKTAPSGFAAIGPAFTVVPGGQVTKSYVLVNKEVAFFGSGNTALDLTGSATSATAAISYVLRNTSDLRGAQIDLRAGGRKGWTYDEGWNKTELKKNWGTVDTSTGAIDLTQEGI